MPRIFLPATTVPEPAEAVADAPVTDPSSGSTANLVSVDKVESGPAEAEAAAPAP